MAKLTPVVIDFESFFSVTHSLTKMSPIEYVMHPETEIISMSIKFGDKPTTCMFGEEAIAASLRHTRWDDKLVIGHNMAGFDSMILAWRFGVRPKMWACTLAMSRPWHMKDVGGSLAKLVQHYGLGVKDSTALMSTKGRHLKDFTSAELDAMREYNIADTEQCYGLFKIFLPKTPKSEMKLIDHTVRMLVEPAFEVDVPLLETTLVEERARKRKMLVDVATMVGAYQPGMEDEDAAEAASKVLASQPKFAALLNQLGVETPLKPSPTNPDKLVPALAKTDEAFIALQTHPDPLVAAAAQARLGVKSTLLETRIEKFLQAASYCSGRLPVPLKYYGGHTGRWSGEQYNCQNLPRINPSKPKPTDALRNSLRAPDGYKVVVADLSGIELRVNHFLWKVPSSMALFEADPEKADVYKDFASKLYGVPVDAVDKQQRQIGKVCVAEGTLILCLHESTLFWCAIENFKPEYQLWDGSEWVWAKGLAFNGWKQTQQLCGVSLTPDHLVLSGQTWTPARCCDEEKTRRALETAAENLSLRAMLSALRAGYPLLSLRATAGFLSTRLRLVLLKAGRRAGAIFAHSSLAPIPENSTGGTPRLSRMMSTASDYSTGSPQLLHAATHQRTSTTTTTAGGESPFALSGDGTAALSSSMPSHWKAGTSRIWKWIVSTLTAGTPRGIFASSPAERTCATSAKSLRWSGESPNSKQSLPVYDILECGPRNRFTVLSAQGPLIVHNCHLGLGFSAGAATFTRIAKLMGGVDMDLDEAKAIVASWRAAYQEIVDGWKKCQTALKHAAVGAEFVVDPWGMCITEKDGIRTPKGLLYYPDLRQIEKDGRAVWVCGEGRNLTYLSGGKVTENCLTADTEVLTSDGWAPIVNVLTRQRLWDGQQWVPHSGVKSMGVKQVLDFGGVGITPEHRVLVNGSWVEAGQTDYATATASCARYYWTPHGDAASAPIHGCEREAESSMVGSMRLRGPEDTTQQRNGKGEDQVLRVQPSRWYIESEQNARPDGAPGIPSVELHETTLPHTIASRMEKLRGAGHNGLRKMGKVLRELLERHAGHVCPWFGVGSDRQRRPLLTGELPVGYREGEHTEQEEQPNSSHAKRANAAVAGGGTIGGRQDDAMLPPRSRVAGGAVVRPASRIEQVYDVLNAGPNNRFTVRGKDGRPFIVHNCVQHLARHVISDVQLKVEKLTGYRPKLCVHDELVYVAPEEEAAGLLDALQAEMRTPPAWWPELVTWSEGDIADTYGAAK